MDVVFSRKCCTNSNVPSFFAPIFTPSSQPFMPIDLFVRNTSVVPEWQAWFGRSKGNARLQSPQRRQPIPLARGHLTLLGPVGCPTFGQSSSPGSGSIFFQSIVFAFLLLKVFPGGDSRLELIWLAYWVRLIETVFRKVFLRRIILSLLVKLVFKIRCFKSKNKFCLKRKVWNNIF